MVEDYDHITFRSSDQYNYCPRCGTETDTEDFPVASLPDGTITKYNHRVICPNCEATLSHR